MRIEQLYPLSSRRTAAIRCDGLPEGSEIFWVQEEPTNMGAWPYIKLNFGDHLAERFQLAANQPSRIGQPQHRQHGRAQARTSRIDRRSVRRTCSRLSEVGTLPDSVGSSEFRPDLLAFAQLIEVLLSMLAFGSRQRLVFQRITFFRKGSFDRVLHIFARDSLAVGTVGNAGDDRSALLDLATYLSLVGVGFVFVFGSITEALALTKPISLPWPWPCPCPMPKLSPKPLP